MPPTFTWLVFYVARILRFHFGGRKKLKKPTFLQCSSTYLEGFVKASIDLLCFEAITIWMVHTHTHTNTQPFHSTYVTVNQIELTSESHSINQCVYQVLFAATAYNVHNVVENDTIWKSDLFAWIWLFVRLKCCVCALPLNHPCNTVNLGLLLEVCFQGVLLFSIPFIIWMDWTIYSIVNTIHMASSLIENSTANILTSSGIH